MSRVKRLIRYLRPYWRAEIVTFIVMMMLAALALALPAALQYMIDTLIPKLTNGGYEGPRFRPVIYFGAFLAGVYFMNILLALARDYLAARISAGIVQDIRTEVFHHLQRVSLQFHHHHQAGEVTARMLSDVNRVQGLLTQTLLMFIANLLLLVAILIYLLNTNWLLTVIALVPVPATIILANRFGKRLNRIARRLQETIARFAAGVQESIIGVKTIKAFGQERRYTDRISGVQDGLTKLYVQNSVTTSLAYNLVHFVNMIGPVVVLSWGTYLVAGGSIQLGALMAFYLLLTYLYQPIKDLASINVEVQAAMASVDRIFEYLDLPPEIVEDPHAIDLQNVHGEIVFDKVSFGYSGSDSLLHDIALRVSPGETLALVGTSGSGKTTLINLLLRFFDPGSGVITIDGVDIRRLSVRSLRSSIGLVEQDPILFKGTIHENIAFACPHASRDNVMAVAKIANIHTFIQSLPGGYDTVIGERGVTVSGGEKQRLCLARAILNEPPVLVLDEATSALDSKSEQLIQEALKQALRNKTSIVVAHRLSTIRHADRIVLFDGGRIIDEGTHESLLARSLLYQDLARGQAIS